MELKQIEKLFHAELDALYEKEEVTNFFYMSLEFMLNLSRLDLALNPSLVVTKEEEIKLFGVLEHLKAEKPIQYYFGETEFFGLPFKVTKSTLIPRPETEELVAWIIEENKHKTTPFSILDIGTGSGCIAITLAKELPLAKVYAVDFSCGAITIAKQNAKLNNVEVNFIEASILESTQYDLIAKQNSSFDIIVSNPPYVRELEKKEMKPNVLANEPHSALFVSDNDPLIFYRTIAHFGESYLKENGQLFYEINEYLGPEMIDLLKENNYKNIVLKQDMFKRDRMTLATKG